jgi:hypothetical protein
MSEPEAPSRPVPFDPRERLRWAIESLRLPAGSNPQFSTPENIAANFDDFVVEVHTTWKRIQVEAITRLVQAEDGEGCINPKGVFRVEWSLKQSRSECVE